MKGFDRFMVVNEIAANGKIGRLNSAEFECLVKGVWPIASKANPRGYLLVAGMRADEYDVARQARCSVAVARRTMKKLRAMGMVELCDDLGVERCHDWDEINPSPKKDSTAAERQRRRRDKLRQERERHGDVTVGVTADVRAGHAGEVEEEVEELPASGGMSGGASARSGAAVRKRPLVGGQDLGVDR